MSFEKMEVVNPAEKEASEVLHSLLSVERRSVDSKEAIIVSIPSDQNGGEYGEGAQWHTPVMGQHSVFEMTTTQNMQQHNYNGHQEQVFNCFIIDFVIENLVNALSHYYFIEPRFISVVKVAVYNFLFQDSKLAKLLTISICNYLMASLQ